MGMWFNPSMLKEVDAYGTLMAFIEAECHGSQKVASGKLGCTPQFVSRLVRGQKPIPDAMLPKLGIRRAWVIEK